MESRPYPSFEQLKRDRQADVFRSQLVVAGGANIFNATLLAAVYLGTAPLAIVAGWWIVTTLIAARTMVMGLRQRQRERQRHTSARVVQRMEIATAFTGAVWGLGAILMFPHGSLAEQVLLAFVVGGTAAGGVAGLNALPRATMAFVLLTLLPIIVWFIVLGGELRYVMAAMMAAFLIVLLLFSRQSNGSFMRATRLQIEASRQSALLAMISRVQTRFIAEHETVAALEQLLDEAIAGFGSRVALLAELPDGEQPDLPIVAARYLPEGADEAVALPLEALPRSKDVKRVLRGGRAQALEEPLDLGLTEMAPLPGAIGSPLVGPDGPQGVLLLAGRDDRRDGWSVDNLSTLSTVAATILAAHREQRDRRAEQAAFAELAERNRIVLESVDEGILVVDAMGRIVRHNDAALVLFGNAALEGKKAETLFPDAVGGDPVGLQAAATGRRVDGTTFPALVSVSAANEAGKPIFVATVQDLTARQSLEDELSRFFASSLDMFFVAGLDGYFLYNNAAWQRILGIDPDTLKTKPFIEFVHPDDRVATMAEYAKLAEGGYEVFEFENRFVTADGQSRWFVWNVTANPPMGRIYGVGRDVTERRGLERMKSDFISLVSHELRTPLTSINASLGLLDDDTTHLDADEKAKMVSIARNNSDRLVRLVGDILELQKLDDALAHDGREPTALIPALERACTEIAGIASQNDVDVELAPNGSGPTVALSEDRILQVATNLLSNAVKYTPAGGKVVCTAADAPADGMVRVSVEDQGPGVPPDFRGEIFTRFARANTDQNRKLTGTGLGLSICKAIVESAGGSISYISPPGRGATFYFDLPLSRDHV